MDLRTPRGVYPDHWIRSTVLLLPLAIISAHKAVLQALKMSLRTWYSCLRVIRVERAWFLDVAFKAGPRKKA